MKQQYRQYRQGDVLLKERGPIPARAKPVNPSQVHDLKEGYSVLAEGEGHGHFHKMLHEAAPMFRDEAGSYIEAKEATPLSHEEHDAIPVDATNYDVVNQRTHNPNFTSSDSHMNAMRVID